MRKPQTGEVGVVGRMLMEGLHVTLNITASLRFGNRSATSTCPPGMLHSDFDANKEGRPAPQIYPLPAADNAIKLLEGTWT